MPARPASTSIQLSPGSQSRFRVRRTWSIEVEDAGSAADVERVRIVARGGATQVSERGLHTRTSGSYTCFRFFDVHPGSYDVWLESGDERHCVFYGLELPERTAPAETPAAPAAEPNTSAVHAPRICG